MGLYVDISLLAGKKRELESDVRRIEELISQVCEEIDQLNKMWDGPGQKSFLKTAAADKERMKEIFLDMKKRVEEIETVQKEYESCEGEVADLIRAIRI